MRTGYVKTEKGATMMFLFNKRHFYLLFLLTVVVCGTLHSRVGVRLRR